MIIKSPHNKKFYVSLRWYLDAASVASISYLRFRFLDLTMMPRLLGEAAGEPELRTTGTCIITGPSSSSSSLSTVLWRKRKSQLKHRTDEYSTHGMEMIKALLVLHIIGYGKNKKNTLQTATFLRVLHPKQLIGRLDVSRNLATCKSGENSSSFK